ncbi:hypothetical protein [Mucilaginibacter psychrotolerans]|nr:hypothetical protein [Mucilaginibacter psychrotolerans]
MAQKAPACARGFAETITHTNPSCNTILNLSATFFLGGHKTGIGKYYYYM